MDPNKKQATDQSAPSRKRAKKQEPNPQAEMKMHKAEDDVLDVIEGVESQLIAMRKAHEEHRKAMTELSSQKRALEEDTSELESRETELTNREVELAEMRQEFESREMNLVQRASGLEQRESKIASQAELLEQQEADLETKDHSLELKIDELDGQLAGLSKRKAELDSLEKQAKEKLAREDEAAKQLAQASKELDTVKVQLDSLNSTVDSTHEELIESQQAHQVAVEELATSKSAHELASEELNTAVSKLRGREIELAERSHTLEDLAEKAGGLEHELNTSRDQYRDQLDETSSQLQQEQRVVEDLRAQVEKLTNDRESLATESNQHADELSSKLKLANQELEAMRKAAQELGEHGQEQDGRFDGLAKELEASQSQVQELTNQVNEIAGCADEELTAQHGRASELEAQIAEITAQVQEVSSQRDAIQAQLDSKPEANPEELAQLQSQLESAQSAKNEAESKLEAKAAELASMQSSLDAEIAKRDEQITSEQAKVQELNDQSAQLFETIEELGAQLEEAQATPKVEVDDWNKNRRSRLANIRRHLQGDAKKIRLATDALRSRYDQCEQVLMKRAELAEAYEAISSAQRKYQGREVRSGMFLGLISIAAITTVIAATSWFVSDRVAPGMYAAKVTMAAASGDSEITEAEMEQWEVYITQLASDPRFIEVASDRMKRRGIGEFAIPGELANEMEQSLDVVSAMPGTVVMEYRGFGAQRTQRVLDTFAVALSSAANNARARRSDSSMTVIEETALVGDEPLDNRRIEMAGMIFGGAMLITAILGGFIWKRLSAAKSRFENDSRVDGLLDDAQWQMPGEG